MTATWPLRWLSLSRLAVEQIYDAHSMCRTALDLTDRLFARTTNGVLLVTNCLTVSRETANAPNRDVPGLRMIASNRFQPSDMVLLDRMPAADVRRQGGLPTDQLRLYRIGREDSGFGIQDSEKAVP